MGVCGILCKSVIMIFNLLYTVAGLAFLMVGVWLRVHYPDESLVTGEHVMIAVGIVMLITAVTGDLGGCHKQTASLASFCVLLAVLMAAQLALYVQREKVEPRLAEFYVYLYTFYVLTVQDPVVGWTLRVIHYTEWWAWIPSPTSALIPQGFLSASCRPVLLFCRTSPQPNLLWPWASSTAMQCCW